MKKDMHKNAIAHLFDEVMEATGLEDKSVSIEAGLGGTYVRDVREGRVKKPGFNNILKLSKRLGVDFFIRAMEIIAPDTPEEMLRVAHKMMLANQAEREQILDLVDVATRPKSSERNQEN